MAAWAACSTCGVAIAASALLPAFSVRLQGFVGAGSAQRSYNFERTYTLVGYGTLGAWALVAAGLALAALGGAGIVTPRPTVPLAAVLVVALAASIATTTPRFTGFDHEGGVYGCSFDRGCGGAFLAPAIRDVRHDVLTNRAAARQPSFELSEGYRAEQRTGWRVIEALAHLVLVGAALALVVRDRRLAPAALALALLAVVVAWTYASGARCSDGDGSSGRLFGWLSAYLLGLAIVAAVGAGVQRRWKWAVGGFGAAVLATPVVFVLELAGSCYYD